jgi:hypothetical protein
MVEAKFTLFGEVAKHDIAMADLYTWLFPESIRSLKETNRSEVESLGLPSLSAANEEPQGVSPADEGRTGKQEKQQKKYLPLPGEKPLKGYRAIAKRMGRKPETVERLWRTKGAPIEKVGGHMEAYDSCLKAWLVDWGKSREKKSSK